MSAPEDDLPTKFVLPDLPAAIEEWFVVGAGRGDDTEALSDGAILDDLGVRDRESARLALIGYRWVYHDGTWLDAAERGEWNPNWIVLDSINADPIIADISSPEVPVLEARHGEGHWDPQPFADSLAEFIAELEINTDIPAPPPFDDAFDRWSVWAIDLGPSPMRTLVSLASWPLFPARTRPELLELLHLLPVQLADGLTEAGAISCVEHGARFGALFHARPPSPVP